ncbi:transposase [Flammeovirgaceae bacterium SG7u.111]|nr:transposase [Flammeovirgaceae bacterium SG7u.132]MDW7693137.1 transposase [Flammeovirgaceae bacterium SG7u.132]WPO33913.1 transposase [Flammeovirgaceae bacterium SG7u.111]WPO37701.1 transposase [Flammeovirgaceae bacterium SG7u.111]
MGFKNFIGIDISKETIDLALLTGHGELVNLKWDNDRDALSKGLKGLFKVHGLEEGDTLLCAEHTGQFGNKLVDTCLCLGLCLWMEPAYAILRSQGLTRGKDDRADAIRIAQYAKRFSDRAKLSEPTPKTIKVLKLLSAERELAVRDLSKYRGQLKQEEGFLDKGYFKEKEKRVKGIIAAYKKTIDEIEEQMGQLIEDDPGIKGNFDKIVSVEGVGMQTAIATIVATENFRKFDDPKKFVCHIGCAPFRYVSGSSIRSRNKVSYKANKELKKIFHMAALSTLNTTGELRKYYDRKVAEGKNKMSVLNAIRSKLVHRIFAVIKQDRKYEKNYTHTLA